MRKIKRKKSEWGMIKRKGKRGVSVILILPQTDWLKGTQHNEKEDAHTYTYYIYIYKIF